MAKRKRTKAEREEFERGQKRALESAERAQAKLDAQRNRD